MKRSVSALLVLLVAGSLLAGCGLWPAEENPYTTTDVVTDMGHAINSIYAKVTWITLVVWVGVFALLGYVILRFRDDGTGRNPEQIHGNTQLEVGWTLIPVALVIVMIVPTVRTIFELADAAPEGAVEVRVVGKRWWWEFEYPAEGIVTANELHIPAGEPVSLALESDSVIHSFWIPMFGGKRDTVPGRINRMWFTVTDLEPKPGEPIRVLGECAEYCGESHALMRFDVIVHTPEDYRAWVEKMKSPAYGMAADVKAAGEAAFTDGGCIGCHALTGLEGATAKRGPDLTYFGNRPRLAAGTLENTPENLAKWLRDPDSVKPGTEGRFDGMNIPVELTEDQIQALVAYLQALE